MTIFRQFGLAAAFAVAMTGTVFADTDPIEGLWKTQPGPIAQISPCDQSFCIVLVSGVHKGKQIGELKPDAAGKYEGEITDPTDHRTYSGTAKIKDGNIKLTGCAFAIFCQTQTWTPFQRP